MKITVNDLQEQDGDSKNWEQFGGIPMLVTFDRNNVKNNRNNLFWYFEYRKFHYYGFINLSENYHLFVTKALQPQIDIARIYLYSYLCLCKLQDYIGQDEYRITYDVSGSKNGELEVRFPVTEEDFFETINDEYQMLLDKIRLKGMTVDSYTVLKKYEWYLYKIDMNKLPKEPFENILQFYRDKYIEYRTE